MTSSVPISKNRPLIITDIEPNNGYDDRLVSFARSMRFVKIRAIPIRSTRIIERKMKGKIITDEEGGANMYIRMEIVVFWVNDRRNSGILR